MAATAFTVNAGDLAKFRKDLRAIDKEADKALREGLRAAVKPALVEAQNLFRPIRAEDAAGYKIRVRSRGVAIEQTRRRTTGDHPEWGRLQLGVALIPAIERKADEVADGLGDTIEDLAKQHGWRA